MPPVALSLHQAAHRIGHYAWIEQRLFELLGRWATTVPDPAVAGQLGVHSRQHAWHAELWHERLPELREIDRNELIVPPDPGLAALVDGPLAPDGADQTLERLVGVYRVVLPHLIVTYTDHLERAAPITDGPTIRVLDLTLREEMEEWRNGERLVHGQFGTAVDVRRAAARQAEIEARLVEAGGVAGPWPTLPAG